MTQNPMEPESGELAAGQSLGIYGGAVGVRRGGVC